MPALTCCRDEGFCPVGRDSLRSSPAQTLLAQTGFRAEVVRSGVGLGGWEEQKDVGV